MTLALIGAGRWGKNIERTLRELSGARLKYVETRRWRSLLRARDVVGVLIATPASTHARIAIPFLERGIPAFIEKPLTSTLREARRLKRAANRSGALVFVGHVQLYNPAYAVAKRAARRAGRIRLLVGEGMNNGPFRDDISALWDWAPHDLAMALDLLGARPVAVRAMGAAVLRPRTRLDDLATIAVRFSNGTEFLGTYSWLSPVKRKRLTIVGSRDTIVFDDTSERKVAVYEGMGPTVSGGEVRRAEPRVTFPKYPTTPALDAELRAFVAMVRTKRRPRSDLAQGLATIRILDAAETSLRVRGAWVRLTRA